MTATDYDLSLATLLAYPAGWWLVAHFVLSWSYWWQTDLPAELTNLLVRSYRLQRIAGVAGRAPDKPLATRKDWFTWINTTYAYQSSWRAKVAQLLSCPRCMSLHLAYVGAGLCWISSHLIAGAPELHWMFIPIAAMTAPGYALRHFNHTPH